jgi:peptidoglycan/xylan/chitin deacetylase (PgdA/CDA1 family)
MKRLVLRTLQHCGIFSFTRQMSRAMPRILMYHNFGEEGGPHAVTPAQLRAQFHYLKRHFRVVSLQQLVGQLASGLLDDFMVAITIDDGRQNCHKVLFPLLQEFRFPATFYVVSSFIRNEDWLWTDKVLWLSEQSTRSSELSTEKLELFFDKLNRMRPAERNARISSISEAMGCKIPDLPPPRYRPCAWSELREMADSGLVEIGSHTVTHPILSSLTDQESWGELSTSRAQIEEGIGREVRAFCFPNGTAADYRRSQIEQARRAGYSNAVVTRFGLVRPGTDPYELPRIGIGGHTDPAIFAKYLDGAEHYQAQVQSRFQPKRAINLQN